LDRLLEQSKIESGDFELEKSIANYLQKRGQRKRIVIQKEAVPEVREEPKPIEPEEMEETEEEEEEEKPTKPPLQESPKESELNLDIPLILSWKDFTVELGNPNASTNWLDYTVLEEKTEDEAWYREYFLGKGRAV
jgi:hypothetical protein